MIHAYEHLLKKNFLFLAEILLINLYEKLKPKIKLLNENITSNNMHVYEGGHGVLFLLKSLDLDLELKKPYGTIFAYGREDIFKQKEDKLK